MVKLQKYENQLLKFVLSATKNHLVKMCSNAIRKCHNCNVNEPSFQLYCHRKIKESMTKKPRNNKNNDSKYNKKWNKVLKQTPKRQILYVTTDTGIIPESPSVRIEDRRKTIGTNANTNQ